MKIIIDENLPPSWVPCLEADGHWARHWQDLGKIGDSDEIILDRALRESAIILSQDLDFSRILALRGTKLPSIVQLRVDTPIPSVCGTQVCILLQKYASQLGQGCLISLERDRQRIRLLPLR